MAKYSVVSEFDPMTWRTISLGVAALLVLAMGCRANPVVATVDGDPLTFESDIQPIVTRSCAFIGCHGREGMPLVLYAVDYARLRDPEGVVDPSTAKLDERALVPAELTHNRRALAARAGPDDPGGEKMLMRLIPVEEGGIPHAAVVVYENPDHPDMATLRAWLETVNAL